MATNRILSNAREFVKKLDAVEKQLLREKMMGIADWMDKVRQSAVNDFMEPNKYKSTTFVRKNRQGDLVAFVRYDGRIYPHRRLQKPVRNKVTIRTGTLAKAVTAPGRWQVNRPGTENKFNGQGQFGKTVLMWIRPQSNGLLCRFTFGKGKSIPFLEYRLAHNRKGRPFIEPAVRMNQTVFDQTVYKRIAKTANQTI